MPGRQNNDQISEVRGRVSKGNRRRPRRPAPVASAVLAKPAPIALMEIPAIPVTVPDWYIYQESYKMQETAKLALALIELGVITEEDALRSTVAQSIKSGMARWFEKASSGINHLVPSLLMADNHALLGLQDCYGDDGNLLNILDEKGLDQDSFLTFAMGVEKYAEFCVNGKMAEFEKLAPGLYSTALCRLYGAADSVTFMAHPLEIQRMCGYLYWMGGEDESEYMDEPEEETDDLYTKAQLETSLTPELLRPTNSLTDEELAVLAEQAGPVGDLARAVLALDGKGWLKEPVSPYNLGKYCGCMIGTLRNDPEDDAQRVLDDYDQQMAEIEDATEFTAVFFANPSVESIKAAMEGISGYCEMLRRIEAALLVMAEKTWPE